MTGAEIVVKQGNLYGYFKFRHDGYFVEDYLILDQNDLKNKTVETVLTNMIKSFMATYGEPESEIDTFYRQGFYTSFSKPIDMYPLHLTDNLNQLNNLLEESLCAELKAKGFNEDEEGLLVGYGDFQVYIDLDDERIYGFFDDNGKTVVYDLNYQIIDESFEG